MPSMGTVAEGPSRDTDHGAAASMDTVVAVLDPSQMRMSQVTLAAKALKFTAGTLEGFLQGGDLLHLVAVCKGLQIAVK